MRTEYIKFKLFIRISFQKLASVNSIFCRNKLSRANILLIIFLNCLYIYNIKVPRSDFDLLV